MKKKNVVSRQGMGWRSAGRWGRSVVAEGLEKRELLSAAAFFWPQVTFGVRAYPASVSSADVNADGKPDLLVPEDNGAGGSVGVLMGNGDGTFAAEQTYAVGLHPVAVAAADLNGDGALDLAVANFQDNTVSVLLGNGNGTFHAASSVAMGAGTDPRTMTAADLNGDGRADLVVAELTHDSVAVLMGNGDGTFAAPQTSATGSAPISVNVVDMNGDGKSDLVVANEISGTVGVLSGNGDGTFNTQRTFVSSQLPVMLATGDVNGDGKPDVVVSSYADGTVSVLKGNGSGGLLSPATFAAPGAQALALADLNGDGKLDVAVTDYAVGAKQLRVLTGDGKGGFGLAETFATGVAPNGVLPVDVNGDGRQDLVVSNKGGVSAFDWSVGVLAGDVPPQVASIDRATPVGPDTAASSVTYAVSFSKPVTGVDANDFRVETSGAASASAGVVVSPVTSFVYTVTVNGIHGSGGVELDLVDNDSIRDAAGGPLGGVGPDNGSFLGPQYQVLQPRPRVVSIDRGLPTGQRTDGTSGVNFTVTFDRTVVGVDAGDFAVVTDGTVSASGPVSVSGSGAVYVVSVNGISGTGTLGLNLIDNGSIHDLNGNPLGGDVPASFQDQQTFAAGSVALALAVSDVNGDGIADVLTVNSGANSVSVLLGNGNGTFKPQETFMVGPSPTSISVGDLNGDGYPDVVTPNENNDTLSVLLGNGDGTFGSRQDIPVGHEPNFVAISDLNGDGRLDLAVANFYSHGIGVLLGNGDGTFGAMTTFGVGANPITLAVGDLNGDGRADLAVSNQYDGTVSVLLGNNDGTFQAQRTLSAGPTANSILISDLNGDGRADVAVSDFNAEMVSVFMGNGNGSFRDQQTFASGVHPLKLVASDLNGDGIRDLLVTNGYGNTVSVLTGVGDGTFQSPQSLATGTLAAGLGVADANGDGKPDILATGAVSQQVGVFLATPIASFTGQTYWIVVAGDSITGTAGADQVTLMMDQDHVHIDWTVGTTRGWMLADDPAGLTVSGNGGNDAIALDYSNGNPLPNILRLSGQFTVNGLQGTSPLAGKTLEIGKSTVYLSYAGTSALDAIRAALSSGYNGGAWNGTSGGGVITSAAAAGNSSHNTGIGWADSADGTGVNTVANSIELKYTLYGDANLNGAVDIFDLNALLPHFNGAGDWTGGDSTYNGSVDVFDLNALLPNFNTTLGSQVSAAVGGTSAGATPAASGSAVTAEAVNAGVEAVRPGDKDMGGMRGIRKKRNW